MTDDVTVARAELARAMERAEELADGGGTGTDIVPARSSDPVQVKRQIAARQAELRKQQAVVKRAAEKLDAAMKREMARVERVLAPIRETVAQLEAGLFSVNLYLGRDEEVVLLRDGESAPADTPIGLRQLLLFMDEEMAAVAPEGGFRPADVAKFDEWLMADPAHLDQVLPERKGIVALRPRRNPPGRDGWRSPAEAEANANTYWLVRNGERVYRTVTLLELDDRVLPYADEMARLFMREDDGDLVALKPGSREWERAQERAGERERTYLRVGLVLEGLLHRTPMFHPLPETGVSFLDPRFVEAGVVRYITDAEGLLGTGAESFEAWRRRLAEELRPGMRIVLGPGLNRADSDSGRGNARLSPRIANLPHVGRVYTIESRGHGRDWRTERSGTEFVFRYHEGERWVGDGMWGGGELREPKRRASCTVYAHDEFVLPFDLATVEEMRAFLHRRSDRHAYEAMFPILKAAIAAKEREAEVEAPFREMLVGVMARENGVSVADAQEVVEDLVQWWKLKNRVHRPLLLDATRQADESGQERVLPSRSRRGRPNPEAMREREERDREQDAENTARATRMIVAEHVRRLADERRPIDEFVVAVLRATYAEGRLLIARPRGRGYVVLVAAEPGKGVYVHEHEFTARGELKETREWVIPRLASVRTWRVVEASARWAEWDFTADEAVHLRGPEREELMAQAVARFEESEDALVLARRRRGRGRFVLWRMLTPATTDPPRPLTGELTAPQIEEIEGRWRRTDDGVVLRWGSGSTSRLGPRNDRTPPWEAREWRRGAGERRREYEPLRSNDEMLSRLQREVDRYRAAQKVHDELNARASLLTDSIEQQWLREQWAAERRRFDEDFGDPELWPAHRDSKERHIRFPSKWDLRQTMFGHFDGPLLWDAVARFVEVGEDPEGRTVRDVLDEATRRWPPEGRDVSTYDDAGEHVVERRGTRFEAPEELLDYELSTYVFSHEPLCPRCCRPGHVEEDCPMPEDEGDDGDELDLLAGVRAALAGEDEDVEEFDVEGDAEEVSLDAGE